MSWLSAITFGTPLALIALALLPVIWWLLRFTPPKPQTITFPPLRLLLELTNRDEQPDKTPWWLMLLRLILLAALIMGISNPAWQTANQASLDETPLLIVIDDGWTTAETWQERKEFVRATLADARAAGATVTLATSTPTTRPQTFQATDASAAEAKLAALAPRPFAPDREGLMKQLDKAFGTVNALRVVWLADGLTPATATAFTEGLQHLANSKARVDVILPDAKKLPLALAAPKLEGGAITVTALRTAAVETLETVATARAANGRALLSVPLRFAPQGATASARIELPVELRNEISHIELANSRNAASIFLLDDRWRRKTVVLQAGTTSESAQPLLSPLYYVSRALEPFAEMAEPQNPQGLADALGAGLSMMVMADIGAIPPDTQTAITAWVQKGGVLVRFAGPRLASLPNDAGPDPLLPVALRTGGRDLSSALSWEEPQALQSFSDGTPFAGVVADPAVRVSRQVLAEPDAELPNHVWASLADGTPLVTAKRDGKGLVVLFHVTANADWSNLPLSGTFVQMLQRILGLAPAAGATQALAQNEPTSDQAFLPRRSLAGDGTLINPSPDVSPIPAALVEKALVDAAHPPGLYARGSQERALNLATSSSMLEAISALPPGVATRSLTAQPARPITPFLFGAAALFLILDMLAALVLKGGIAQLRRGHASIAVLLLLLLPSPHADAQTKDDSLLRNALDTRLAYVETGDPEIDRVSAEGLAGLNAVLRDRTSVETSDPAPVDIERDEIVFYPLLYWPIRNDMPTPSSAALSKITAYMKNGGTIFFDLRDPIADDASLSGGASAALRQLLMGLDVPPLEPVPKTHVLTRSFYLLQNFPGRYDGGRLWVEQMDPEGSAVGNVDGVSTIIIGSNDYAAAWATDDAGEPLYAVTPGGERQREMALRSGVNIVMYALTGNYKSDQVHVPELLERLGQ